MKAKELLKEIAKAYPDVVAIAQDRDGDVYVYYLEIPEREMFRWDSNSHYEQFNHEKLIQWDSENWKENIVTINDLENESN